jgi:hypothetical protein
MADASDDRGDAMGGKAVNPTPARNLRVDTELWERFDEATKLLGTTRSDWLRDAIRWCVGEPGAEEPPRGRGTGAAL